ncbi:MAG: ADP-ribosylglycohydrolase family protein [Kiritimatiellia bacterium]
MSYPSTGKLKELVEQIGYYVQLKHEYRATGIRPVLRDAEHALGAALYRLKNLPIDKGLAHQAPNDLDTIRALRPSGPRRMWDKFDSALYREKVEGALLGRMAGCTLGAPVESWSIERMQALAQENGDDFPPTDYWSAVPEPWVVRYGVSPRSAYTRAGMSGVPVDDDLAYTILGLLILEQFGPEFTTEDVGVAWLKYLPYACTAEKVALENLRSGCPARRAGEKNNPYCDWIGAAIRADPWGYLAPGWPERAAEMAYRDAYLSHRRQGIYGEMFFAAAIAAAFAVDDPLEALKIGLTEIPADCVLAQSIRWALRVAPEIHGYEEARSRVDERFKGMHVAHTINNACLTVWGLTLGRTDFTRVIGTTVAMGLDNDCTAATAGSIVGTVIGRARIPAHWYRRFYNTVHSYLVGHKKFTITGLVERFARQAARVHTGG